MPTARDAVEHNGCRLAFAVSGRGPAVLFIQGVGVQGDAWEPQTDALQSHFTCVWFDNRGMGQSRPAARPITVATMADDARAIMGAVGLASAHVVGHSLGGLVALEVAASTPSRVRSLSLLCTFPSGRTAAPLGARMMWLGLRSRVGTRRMRQRGFLELVLPPGALAGDDAEGELRISERLARLFGHDLADQPPIVSQQLRALRGADLTSRLPALAGIPTLVVTATHDPIAPPSAGRALSRDIPGARYVEIADASHGLPLTHVDRTNALLLQHLSEAPSARAEVRA